MSNILFFPVTNGVVSTDTGAPVRFTLTNNSAEHLTVYWVDRAGALQPYVVLDQGGSYSQSTVSSHVWEVKSDDGLVAFKFEPTLAGNITIGKDYQPTFTDFSEQVSHTSNGLWSTAQGYGLINVAKSLGIADTTALPLNGQNNNLALDAISAPAAWAAGYTGKGVKVAVIDIGIANNAEVAKNIVGGYDFYQKDSDPTPNAGTYIDHALGVASIIAASHDLHNGQDTMGVAPDAQLLNVRVGSSVTGSGTAAISAGIHYAVDNGAKVICMPLENSGDGVDQNVVEAVHYAYTHGTVMVIIGGNYSNYGPTGPAMIAQIAGEAIDVGNYNVMTGTAFESSNMPGATPFPWVMASSSGYVPNSAGAYTYWGDGGTSFAGPYVAGLAALLFQQSPNATASEIINKIIYGASIGQGAATSNITAAPIIGTANNDSLVAVSGASIDGGKGIDTVQFHGASAGYVIATTATGLSVTNVADHSVNLLTNVERLSFSDHNVLTDATGNGGEVFRLYQAAFNRTPDAGGLGFWLNAVDNGVTLESVAKSFSGSTEFKALYGANPTAEQLVTATYQNVLHRAPDATGMAFWVDAMNHGQSAAQLLTAFSESNENQVALVGVITHGVAYTPIHA